ERDAKDREKKPRDRSIGRKVTRHVRRHRMCLDNACRAELIRGGARLDGAYRARDGTSRSNPELPRGPSGAREVSSGHWREECRRRVWLKCVQPDVVDNADDASRWFTEHANRLPDGIVVEERTSDVARHDSDRRPTSFLVGAEESSRDNAWTHHAEESF